MKDYVNEVLEQMNDKYIWEAANYQQKKKFIHPRVVAVIVAAACLLGVTAMAYSQGWVFEKDKPQAWEDYVAENTPPALPKDAETEPQETAPLTAVETPPEKMYSYRVHFTTEAYDKFTDEQMAFLDAHYGEKMTYADFAETKEALGLELLTLKDFAQGEQVTVDIKGSRGADQYKQVLIDYELARSEENLRVIADVSLKTNGVENFSVGGSYARPIMESEYWIEALGVNAKLVSMETKASDAASVVWAYFTYENMTYTLQIIDKDVPTEKLTEACDLLETLYK